MKSIENRSKEPIENKQKAFKQSMVRAWCGYKEDIMIRKKSSSCKKNWPDGFQVHSYNSLKLFSETPRKTIYKKLFSISVHRKFI